CFFFQAEDGIRDFHVTGVQTCALPIFGVVMFLFIIGLEMEPSRLWNLRRQIFGLGMVQVGTCGALLTGVGLLLGFPAPVAFVAEIGRATCRERPEVTVV